MHLLKNLYKLVNAETSITHMKTNVCDMERTLIKKETENEVQNNIISMLSHDLKGSAKVRNWTIMLVLKKLCKQWSTTI